MGLINRIYNIARSSILDKAGFLKPDVDVDDWMNAYSERFKSYYDRASSQETEFDDFEPGAGGGFRESSRETPKDRPGSEYADYPKQVVDDLWVFNLKPPASLDEVRKARNREINKYHPDRFMNEPKKMETSKEIMQIYNAAFDRLETYYNSKRPG